MAFDSFELGRADGGRSGPLPGRARLSTGTGAGWLWLSLPLAALSAIAAAAGILVDATYERDAADFAAQARAQDYVTLLIAVPALLVLWRLAVRGSLPARLLWHGAVFYFAYTYTIAAFMVRFNDLFLVYTSAVGCAIFALLGSITELGRSLEPNHFDPDRWPRRPVAGLLLAIVVVSAGLWLSDIVPALRDGVEPASLVESRTPTNGVEVIDLSLLLPGAAVVAVWVLRGRVRGYSLATGLLGYIALLGLALVAMVVGQYAGDFIDSPAPAVLFALLVAATLALLVRIVRATATRPGTGPAGDQRP
jgi:hypothetical protein